MKNFMILLLIYLGHAGLMASEVTSQTLSLNYMIETVSKFEPTCPQNVKKCLVFQHKESHFNIKIMAVVSSYGQPDEEREGKEVYNLGPNRVTMDFSSKNILHLSDEKNNISAKMSVSSSSFVFGNFKSTIDSKDWHQLYESLWAKESLNHLLTSYGLDASSYQMKCEQNYCMSHSLDFEAHSDVQFSNVECELVKKVLICKGPHRVNQRFSIL